MTNWEDTPRELLEGLRIDRSATPRATPRRFAPGLPWRRIAGVAALAVAVIAGSWRLAAARAVRVELYTVSAPGPGAPAALLTAGGYVRAATVIYVVPRVSGRLAEIRVQEGDEVAEGDVLATIDSRDLGQDAAAARAEVAIANANLAKLRAGARPEEIAEAQARAGAASAAEEAARRELARDRSLYAEGIVSAQALDKAATDLAVAESQLAATRQAARLVEAGPRSEEIRSAEAELAAARARSGAAENRLGYATVRAPMAGRVLRKFANAGEFVAPGTPHVEGSETVALGSPIVLLADPGRPEVAADINETDIGKVRLHQPVEVASDAYPGVALRGEVTQISPRADRNKNTIEVKATLERTDRVIPYDMSVKISFLEAARAEASPAVVRIPASALLERNGGRFVYVASGSRAVLRAVETGKRDGEMVVVSRGLREGDRVVVTDLDALQDGKRIEPR